MLEARWLFGPGPGFVSYDGVGLPSLVLDIDIVRDIIAIMDAERPQKLVEARLNDPGAAVNDDDLIPRSSVVIVHSDGTVRQYVEWDDIRTLTATDRHNMRVIGDNIVVDFRRAAYPQVAGGDPVKRERIADRMIAEAHRRRPRWRSQLWLLSILGALTVAASWIWFVVTVHPEAPTTALTGVLTAAAIAFALHYSRDLRLTWVGYYPGHKFTEVTRAEIRDKLASDRARAINAAIFTPIGAILGALAVYVIGLFLR